MDPRYLLIQIIGKKLLPTEIRILQFMKEYVELMYLPWLWTLQDLFLKEYNDLTYLETKKSKSKDFKYVYDEILHVKILEKVIVW